MANMRVHELAKELGKTNKDVMDVLKKKNVDVQSHMAALSDDLVEYVKSNIHKEVSKSDDAPKKKKPAFVFRPQNSSQPITKNHRQAGSKVVPAKEEHTKDVEVKTSDVATPETKKNESKKSEVGITEAKPVETTSAEVKTIKKEGSVITEDMKKSEVVQKEEKTVANMKDDSTKNKITEMNNDNNSEDNKVEKHQEQRRDNYQGGYQGQRRDNNQGGYQGQRRDNNQGGYQGQRRDNNQGGYQGQRRDNNQGGGYQGQRRDNNQGGYQGQRRDNNQGGYQGQRRDNNQGGGYQGQRRDNNQGGGYQGQRRDNNQGGYQGQRRDNNQGGGYQGQRRDNNQGGGYQGQRRDNNQGGGYQGQRRDNNQGGGYQGQRRDNNQGGGYQGQRRDNNQGGGYQGQRRDNNQGGYQGQRRDGQGSAQGQRRDNNSRGMAGLDTLAPTLSKNETRGGKPLNKKERENREKSKLYDQKSGKRQENTKNIDKLKSTKKIEQQPVKEDTIKTIVLPDVLTIKELAEKMKQQPSALVKKLFLQGKMVTINSEVDFDTAEEIALDFNYICEKEIKVDVIEELLRDIEDPEDTLVSRPPVVCVMGHVDHGKTSLLDAIRSTNVTEREAGGITQHIGAYVVKCNDQDITFLDTPGHEAFTAMRMRGAKSTDIAILVVAADDGVMPQTVEAINHAKAAGVEIIVAINKIDKPSANIDRVKQEMAEHELVPEDWGGNTIFVPVSARTREGIENLLEMITLVAEIKELKANPNRNARGLVIEAELDKGRGSVATVLVQKGTLHVGDSIAAGSCYGKVRAMIDDKGRRVKEAGPSRPVEILGLNGVPNAGEIFVSTSSEKEARNFAETFISEGREKLLEDTKAKLTLDGLFSQIQSGNIKELGIIIKADVQGSVEAVKQSLVKLSNDEVIVKVIHGGVGSINESDVMLASASNAIIIGFNVRPDATAKSVADREKVDLRLYRVIYQAIEDVEAAMKGMLDPVFEEKVIGTAVVRQTFKASGVGTIAGSYVTNGVIQRGCSIRITRDGELIFDGPLASLKRFNDDVKEVKENYECGLVFEKFNDVKEDDQLEAYKMVEVPR